MNMPQPFKLHDDISAAPDSSKLIENVSTGIGKLSVELADVLGNLHFVLSAVGDDKDRWFCSEAVAAALGMPNPERFDPGTLHAALSFHNQPAAAGFFTPAAEGSR